jgi:hypothetical protein
LDCKIFEGHQRWRAQTGITFQVITSGIPQ